MTKGCFLDLYFATYSKNVCKTKQNNFSGWLESCMNITTKTALFGFFDDTHKMLRLFNVVIICKLHMCKSRKHFAKIMGL